jgi:hypothetical protein
MEDPQNSMNAVSAQTYDRNLTNKLYEISNNVSQQHLQNIINDNIKTENEFNLNVPSSSSSSFSDLSSFKKEDDGELPGEGMDSEDDTNDETTGGESSNEILPEDSNLLIQNNNSGNPRPVNVTSRPLDINQMARREEYNIMTGDSVLNNNK